MKLFIFFLHFAIHNLCTEVDVSVKTSEKSKYNFTQIAAYLSLVGFLGISYFIVQNNKIIEESSPIELPSNVKDKKTQLIKYIQKALVILVISMMTILLIRLILKHVDQNDKTSNHFFSEYHIKLKELQKQHIEKQKQMEKEAEKIKIELQQSIIKEENFNNERALNEVKQNEAKQEIEALKKEIHTKAPGLDETAASLNNGDNTNNIEEPQEISLTIEEQRLQEENNKLEEENNKLEEQQKILKQLENEAAELAKKKQEEFDKQIELNNNAYKLQQDQLHQEKLLLLTQEKALKEGLDKTLQNSTEIEKEVEILKQKLQEENNENNKENIELKIEKLEEQHRINYNEQLKILETYIDIQNKIKDIINEEKKQSQNILNELENSLQTYENLDNINEDKKNILKQGEIAKITKLEEDLQQLEKEATELEKEATELENMEKSINKKISQLETNKEERLKRKEEEQKRLEEEKEKLEEKKQKEERERIEKLQNEQQKEEERKKLQEKELAEQQRREEEQREKAEKELEERQRRDDEKKRQEEERKEKIAQQKLEEGKKIEEKKLKGIFSSIIANLNHNLNTNNYDNTYNIKTYLNELKQLISHKETEKFETSILKIVEKMKQYKDFSDEISIISALGYIGDTNDFVKDLISLNEKIQTKKTKNIDKINSQLEAIFKELEKLLNYRNTKIINEQISNVQNLTNDWYKYDHVTYNDIQQLIIFIKRIIDNILGLKDISEDIENINDQSKTLGLEINLQILDNIKLEISIVNKDEEKIIEETKKLVNKIHNDISELYRKNELLQEQNIIKEAKITKVKNEESIASSIDTAITIYKKHDNKYYPESLRSLKRYLNNISNELKKKENIKTENIVNNIDAITPIPLPKNFYTIKELLTEIKKKIIYFENKNYYNMITFVCISITYGISYFCQMLSSQQWTKSISLCVFIILWWFSCSEIIPALLCNIIMSHLIFPLLNMKNNINKKEEIVEGKKEIVGGEEKKIEGPEKDNNTYQIDYLEIFLNIFFLFLPRFSDGCFFANSLSYYIGLLYLRCILNIIISIFNKKTNILALCIGLLIEIFIIFIIILMTNLGSQAFSFMICYFQLYITYTTLPVLIALIIPVGVYFARDKQILETFLTFMVLICILYFYWKYFREEYMQSVKIPILHDNFDKKRFLLTPVIYDLWNQPSNATLEKFFKDEYIEFMFYWTIQITLSYLASNYFSISYEKCLFGVTSLLIINYCSWWYFIITSTLIIKWWASKRKEEGDKSATEKIEKNNTLTISTLCGLCVVIVIFYNMELGYINPLLIIAVEVFLIKQHLQHLQQYIISLFTASILQDIANNIYMWKLIKEILIFFNVIKKGEEISNKDDGENLLKEVE